MKSNYFMGNGRFQMTEEPIPEVGGRDVLIRVAACGVCGTDVHIYHGDQGSAPVNPPVVLGHELAGTVVRTGKDVKRFRPGDAISVDPNAYCGQCHYCQIGKKQLCTALYAVGVNRNGGFAEYCAVPEAQCYALSPDVPLEYGAMVEPLACCLHGIDRAEIRTGDTVCVLGGGAIGLMMVQLAKLSGAGQVILSEPVEMRRQVGLRVGADAAVDPVQENLPQRIRELTGQEGVDVVVECVGNPVAAKQSLEITKRGTTVLLFSVPQSGTALSVPLDDIYRKELKIIGSIINPDTHARAVSLINSGRIRLAPIITHSYPLEQLQEAILMQQSAESIKVIVKP